MVYAQRLLFSQDIMPESISTQNNPWRFWGDIFLLGEVRVLRVLSLFLDCWFRWRVACIYHSIEIHHFQKETAVTQMHLLHAPILFIFYKLKAKKIFQKAIILSIILEKKIQKKRAKSVYVKIWHQVLAVSKYLWHIPQQSRLTEGLRCSSFPGCCLSQYTLYEESFYQQIVDVILKAHHDNPTFPS